MDLESYIESIVQNIDISNHPYFVALKTNMSKDKFTRTQEQFYFAVTEFIVPMALTAAAIPSYPERIQVVKNLWEEHGEGNLDKTHGATFSIFLYRLGTTDLTQIRPADAVQHFNSTLKATAMNRHYLISVAMMGMIERLFSDISFLIGSTVVTRRWLKAEEMIHYTLHHELDVLHAKDFFDILKPHIEINGEIIREGLLLGSEAIDQLYNELLRESHD
jgi:pyrroloquinoline-quinone synthase